MSSQYNSRPRAIELLVDKDQVHVIRQRETIAQLMSGEQLLPPDIT
jgi:diaminopimelate decarboxylase